MIVHLTDEQLDACELEADATSDDGQDAEPWSRHFARAVARAFCEANGLSEQPAGGAAGDVLAELDEAARRKWRGDPAAQRAGLFARAAEEIRRLRGEAPAGASANAGRGLDATARQAVEVRVLETAVAVVSRALDELVGACTDADGKPCAPERGALMRARSVLPPACKHALKKA